MTSEYTPLRAETEPLPTLDDLRNGKILQRTTVEWANGGKDLRSGRGRRSTSVRLNLANRGPRGSATSAIWSTAAGTEVTFWRIFALREGAVRALSAAKRAQID